MATGNRKSTSGSKKTDTRRRTNSKQKGNVKGRQENSMTREVVLWIVIAVSLLLFISNFGVGGIVGNTVSSFFFGIFGLIAYVFPIILLVGTFFVVSNKGNTIATVKIIAACLFVAFLCMFISLIWSGEDVGTPLEAYLMGYSDKQGGGMVGGSLAYLICQCFGRMGAYVIDVIVLIISLVLITERSFLKGMQKGGKKVYESAKTGNERYRERAEQRKEERELRRMDRKVEGVAIDTRIIPETREESDDVSELYPDSAIELPEIKEEAHVTLTAENPFAEAMTPSAFSEEALAAFQYSDTAVQPEAVTEIRYPEAVPETRYPEESIVLPEIEYVEPEYEEPEPAMSYNSVSDTVQKTEIHTNTEKRMREEPEEEISDIASEIKSESEPPREYVLPPTELLTKVEKKAGDSGKHLQEMAMKLQQTLKNFGVNVTITNISCGPTVTRYELQPEMGVKVSKIVNLADDIKLNLAAADIRIEAPIPGKAAIGIEVPNKENVMVSFRELVESEEFQSHTSNISFCVGKDIGGKVMVADIAKMPHVLIAGSTGSGKSVCINTIIMSILYKANPRDVKLIMVDPKVVELSVYNGIPHLMIPVVTDPKKAAGALHWAVSEMMERYDKFAAANVRDLKGYNAKIESLPTVEGDPKPEKMPQLVIIVDELADLMMVAQNEVEEAICRLAQLARAAGIHLIIATQRPSVNVITGLIKANMPSRIAFAVTSGIDSRTILDMNGAEKLLGKGDMLFSPQGAPKPIRVQGAFVSDKEVSDVVDFIKEQNGQVSYSAEIEEKMNSIESSSAAVAIDSGAGMGDGRDSYFADAAKLLIDKEKGSIGMLQRYFKIGFNRAARIMDQLEEAGIVGPEEGTKPRRVLMSPEQFEQFMEEEL
ncbi:MAG: DNA translocase FtsK [Roseburia sp.]|nr:DNA translocase FtsK [Roseburia sp.]